MSPELGMAIMDTMIRYWTPRACVLFGWECASEVTTNLTNTREPLVDVSRIQISPNPSAGNLRFQTPQDHPMESIQIFSVTGAMMYETQVENDRITIDDVGLSSGIYLAKVRFEDGIATKKITIER